MVLDTTDDKFQNDVMMADRPVLLDVWANWCGPCFALFPILDKLADDYTQDIRIIKLDADHNPATLEKFRIRLLPTLILFQEGQIVSRLTGLQPEKTLRTLIESL